MPLAESLHQLAAGLVVLAREPKIAPDSVCVILRVSGLDRVRACERACGCVVEYQVPRAKKVVLACHLQCTHTSVFHTRMHASKVGVEKRGPGGGGGDQTNLTGQSNRLAFPARRRLSTGLPPHPLRHQRPLAPGATERPPPCCALPPRHRWATRESPAAGSSSTRDPALGGRDCRSLCYGTYRKRKVKVKTASWFGVAACVRCVGSAFGRL